MPVSTRSSRRRTIAALAVGWILGAASLFLFLSFRDYVREYNAVSDFLIGITGSVGRDLGTDGISDLRNLRTSIPYRVRYPTPLVWTEVDVISNSSEYNGRVICCFPKGYFRKLGRRRWGVALIRDSDGKGYYARIHTFHGSPDFLTEKNGDGPSSTLSPQETHPPGSDE
jgi:hypothetical protein